MRMESGQFICRPNVNLFLYSKQNFNCLKNNGIFTMDNKNNILKGKPKTLYRKIIKSRFLSILEAKTAKIYFKTAYFYK